MGFKDIKYESYYMTFPCIKCETHKYANTFTHYIYTLNLHIQSKHYIYTLHLHMAISFFYIYVMATSFYYIYVFGYQFLLYLCNGY